MTDIGDYRVMGKLGEGTFSEVIRVRNRRTGKYYAMKRFKKHFKGVDEIECLREIQALRRLNHHPNIIQLEEVIFDSKYGVLSLAFELMDANLYEVLSKKGSPPIHETRAKWIMWQVMKAMDFVHSKGIFHRDIKPENILVRGDIHAISLPFPNPDAASPFHHSSSFPLIKLADLGSCRGVHSAPPFTEYIATRWYRSPECLMFDGVYGFKMDMWGLGCVFFELITKIPLFPGDDEIDQLHKIHNVLGTPSERLLKIMVMAGQQAVANGKSDKGTSSASVINDQDTLTGNAGGNGSNGGGAAAPAAAAATKPGTRGIFKRPYQFPATKGCGLRAAFPPHILYGAHRVPPKTAASQPGYHPTDYPGITDDCVNLIELLLQYDPDGRPSARQILKHPWLKECRDVEALEKQRLKELQQVFEQQPPEILKSAPLAAAPRRSTNGSSVAARDEAVAAAVASVSALPPAGTLATGDGSSATSGGASWTKAGRRANMAAMATKLSAIAAHAESMSTSSAEQSPALPPRIANATTNGGAKVLAPLGAGVVRGLVAVPKAHATDLTAATTSTKSPLVKPRLDHIQRGASLVAQQPAVVAPVASVNPRLAALGESGLTIRRTGSIKYKGAPPVAAGPTTLPRLMRAATLHGGAATVAPHHAQSTENVVTEPQRNNNALEGAGEVKALDHAPTSKQASVSVLGFSQPAAATIAAELIEPVLSNAMDTLDVEAVAAQHSKKVEDDRNIAGDDDGNDVLRSQSKTMSTSSSTNINSTINNSSSSNDYHTDSMPPSLTSTGASRTAADDRILADSDVEAVDPISVRPSVRV